MGKLGTTKEGTTSAGIVKVIKEYGFAGKLKYNLKMEDIIRGMKRGKVYIVNYQLMREKGKSWKNTWEYGHYSVVADIDKEYIYIMDPWDGMIEKMDRDKFIKRWHDTDKNGKNWGTGIEIKGAKNG